MNSWTVAAIAFGCMFSAAYAAMQFARFLPDRHRAKETQDAVKLGVGMIAAMSSLILGLMTASVKGAFDGTDRDIHTYASYIVNLDGTLRHYGPEAEPARDVLAQYGISVIAELWNAASIPDIGSPVESSGHLIGQLEHALRRLQPDTDDQRQVRMDAITRFNTLVATRWTVIEESVTQIPTIFTVMLIAWLTLIFLSFGLFAPRNVICIGALLLCSSSIAGSLFLIIEMSAPFEGLITISPRPMIDALAVIDRPVLETLQPSP